MGWHHSTNMAYGMSYYHRPRLSNVMLPGTFRLTLTSCLQFLAIDVVDTTLNSCATQIDGELRNFIKFKTSCSSTIPPTEVFSLIEVSRSLPFHHVQTSMIICLSFCIALNRTVDTVSAISASSSCSQKNFPDTTASIAVFLPTNMKMVVKR